MELSGVASTAQAGTARTRCTNGRTLIEAARGQVVHAEVAVEADGWSPLDSAPTFPARAEELMSEAPKRAKSSS